MPQWTQAEIEARLYKLERNVQTPIRRAANLITVGNAQRILGDLAREIMEAVQSANDDILKGLEQ